MGERPAAAHFLGLFEQDGGGNADETGGIVELVVTGVPAGLAEPVFDKLDD